MRLPDLLVLLRREKMSLLTFLLQIPSPRLIPQRVSRNHEAPCLVPCKAVSPSPLIVRQVHKKTTPIQRGGYSICNRLFVIKQKDFFRRGRIARQKSEERHYFSSSFTAQATVSKKSSMVSSSMLEKVIRTSQVSMEMVPIPYLSSKCTRRSSPFTVFNLRHMK